MPPRWTAPVQAHVRQGRTRDRRGRGLRGPAVLPGPHSPSGVPSDRTPAEEFDELVLALAERVRTSVGGDGTALQFAVEDTPVLPADWDQPVPLVTTTEQPCVVVFRRPVQQRTRGRIETTELVLDLLVDEVAGLLGRPADEIDPR